jgi:hypothetical protein
MVFAFYNTSRYLYDIFNLDNSYFDQMVPDIYPHELQLNKTNYWNFSTSCSDLHITINKNSIHTKIYDKRDDFDFCIINYPHLDGDVPHATSYGIYVSHLMRFARACNNVKDFNEQNIFITSKLLKQGYRYKILQS